MTVRHIAAIDIGTNSFHLLIAKINGESFETIHRERKVLRLRMDSQSESHIIQEDKIYEAAELLKEFAFISKQFNAEIYAVATSAIRDAINKVEVCKKINDITGINIKVLSGDEEAELSFKAALYRKEISNKKILVFDLGGGSTEFIVGLGRKIIYKTSLKLGAVRLSQQYLPDFYLTDERIEKLRNNVGSVFEIVREDILALGFDYCIGIGGTITALSWLIEKYVFNRGHNFSILTDYQITKNDFDLVKEIILKNKSVEERKLIDGLELKRADIIPAGIIIIDELFSSFQIQEIIASGNSIKEGIILNEIHSN